MEVIKRTYTVEFSIIDVIPLSEKVKTILQHIILNAINSYFTSSRKNFIAIEVNEIRELVT